MIVAATHAYLNREEDARHVLLRVPQADAGAACRYADRAIRSVDHYRVTLNYIHYNPVKHRYARTPYAWRQSSVHWYLERYGREWLRELWARYPLRSYGRGWDEAEL